MELTNYLYAQLIKIKGHFSCDSRTSYIAHQKLMLKRMNQFRGSLKGITKKNTPVCGPSESRVKI